LAYKSGEATVSFPDGRAQIIHVRRIGDSYLLTSRVIGSTKVANMGSADLACQIWSRNRATDVVEFALDESGRLVGRIEQVAETLNRNELEFYLTALAQECDRFEYLLTGRDQM
jgi:transglutaminase-like putative cysteine protease